MSETKPVATWVDSEMARPSPEELARIFSAHGQVDVGPRLRPDD